MDLWAQQLHEVPIAALDLEMTGLSVNGDRICEIALVVGERGDIRHVVQSLVQPGVPMGKRALACHGISEENLFGAPVFDKLSNKVRDVFANYVVVAHNVHFDLGFLSRAFERAAAPLQYPVTVDTLQMARRLFRFPRNDLATVCSQVGISLNAHRALNDARATFELYYRMIDAIDPNHEVTIRELTDLLSALAPNSPLRLRQQQQLRTALERKKRVHLTYQCTSDPLNGWVSRTVSVWSIRFPRFEGYCHLRNARRVFRVDRIRELKLLDEESLPLPDAFQGRI